jgi:uncharacterized protein YlxW (UPF0749 family)
MGLLNYITATSLDEDYAHVSKRRAAVGNDAEHGPDQKKHGTGATALVILAMFGLLVATAFVQTAQSADDAQQRHEELVEQVLARRAQLERQRDRLDELRIETETLQTASLQATAQGRSVQSRLDRLGLSTGADAARGPGVRVVVDDGPPTSGEDSEVLDVDLQKLVNGLWLAGAEGISVNGERLTSLSAIRLGGSVITVNYERISGPYTVEAVGDPDTLAARFVDTPGGQWWLDLQSLYGLEFEIDRVESMTLPAASRVKLRHAHAPETLP